MTIISCSFKSRVNGGLQRRRRRKIETFFHHASLTLVCFALSSVALLSGVKTKACAEKASPTTSTQRKLIINGDPASPSDHQFFLRSWPDSMTVTEDILCGASLIHSDIILTVAHCHGGFNNGAMAYDPNSENFERLKTVDLQIAYPKYYQNLAIFNYDVMIMRLSSPIKDVEPIILNNDPDFPLNRKNSGASYLLEGMGVGVTETGFVSRGLEVGFFNAITNNECMGRLGNLGIPITDDIMCADPSTDDSICAGDSGGPLTASISVSAESNDVSVSRSPWVDLKNFKTVQVGITSFGNECQTDSIPDGFARISYFHKWITRQICKYSRDPPAECLEYFQSEDYLEFVSSQESSAMIWPNKARITMEFQHDFLAEETVFVVRNTATNEIEYVGPQYVPQRGEFVVSNFMLPVAEKYSIEIYDSGGDGLRNPDYVDADYPQGSWTISAEYSNGARIEGLASGDYAFESYQEAPFMLPRRLPSSITASPQSMSPTPTLPVPLSLNASGENIDSSSSLVTHSRWVMALFSLPLAVLFH